MKVININTKIKINEPLTLTIGNFDGLHLGHQKLIDKVKTYNDTKHAALTFDPHPRKYFFGDSFKTLYNLDGKIKLFEEKDLDYLLIANFNKEFSKLSVDEFINLLKRFNVKRLVIGEDFKFAHKAKGTVLDLKKHFIVDEIKLIKKDSKVFSTTIIKEEINKGNIINANNLLGYNYFVLGEVEHGNKVGRTLGFPTANINYHDVFLPNNGVYFTTIEIDNKIYNGITNIGYNPTVNMSKSKKLEVYILNFNKDIYDKNVKVTFYERIRDEVKFNSVEELIDAMKMDEKISLKLIKKYNL